MQTDKTFVSSSGTGVEKALAQSGLFSRTEGLARKDAMHLRLLSEETMGMVRSITEEFNAMFWIQGDRKSANVFLEARADMNRAQRRKLIALSTNGRNMAVRGVMGKIREIVETGISDYELVNSLQTDYGTGTLMYGSMGGNAADAMSQAVFSWSLQRYRDNIKNEEEELAKVAVDELEKSIVANLADDIKVGIQKDRVELSLAITFSGT
ncbi:MAG: hypothetical protein K5985_02560 [Lachnospiraceae bacterium]|nr:hypothetical protein [Lachnospiraceae bacterium]